MMLLRYFLFLLLLLNVSACIPYKIAPNYSEGEVVKGKKFIKTFKNRYVFAFNDPKEANAFYTYINYKFQTSYDDDLGNVPIQIEDELAYLTFYELEKTTETYNLFPMMVDGMLSEKGVDPVLESQYNSRSGNWYIVMTLTDALGTDCLRPSHSLHESSVAYLQTLREEYLRTSQYNELLFVKQR